MKNKYLDLLSDVPATILGSADLDKIKQILSRFHPDLIDSYILEYHILADVPKVDYALRLGTLELDKYIPAGPTLELVQFMKRLYRATQSTYRKIWLEYDLDSDLDTPSIFFDLNGVKDPEFFLQQVFIHLDLDPWLIPRYLTHQKAKVYSFSAMINRTVPEFKIIYSDESNSTICKTLQTQYSVNLLDPEYTSMEFLEPSYHPLGMGENLITVLKDVQKCPGLSCLDKIATLLTWMGKHGDRYNRLCHIKTKIKDGKHLGLKCYLSSSFNPTH
jgi:hypothetical protein